MNPSSRQLAHSARVGLRKWARAMAAFTAPSVLSRLRARLPRQAKRPPLGLEQLEIISSPVNLANPLGDVGLPVDLPLTPDLAQTQAPAFAVDPHAVRRREPSRRGGAAR